MVRNRVIAWGLGVILAAVIVGAVATYFIARSQSFHRYVLSKIIEQTSRATGGRVEIAAYRLRWSPLGVDLYGITIHGTEAKSEPPLAGADHLAVDLKILSVLRRKVDLKAIVLERPVVRLLVGRDGRSNVPQPEAPRQTTKAFDVFDLAVKDFRISRGEIFYNDRQIPVDAELHQLETRVRFADLRNQYEGSLDYRQGRLRFGGWNTLQHDVEATFRASRSRLTVEQLAVSSGSSRIVIQASLDDYAHPSIHAVYKVAVSGRDVGQVLKNAAFPSGDIRLDGTADYRNVLDRPFLDGVSAEGNLYSSSLRLPLAQAFAEIRAVHGRFKLENGNLQTRGIQADLLGGHLTADLTAKGLSDRARFQLEAGIRSVSLDSVSAALGLDSLREASFGGRVDATATAAWRGSFESLQIKSDATITASIDTAGHPTVQAAIPVNGAVHLFYDDAREVLSLTRSSVRTPRTEVLLDGTVGHSSLLSLVARSDELHEVDLVALALRRATAPRPAGHSKPQLWGLYGFGMFKGNVEGSIKEPRLNGDLRARDVQFQDAGWRSVRADIHLSPHSIRLRHGELTASTGGRVTCDAEVGLSNWSYTPSSPVAANVAVTAMSVRDILHLANAQYPVAGTLSGRVGLRGTPLHLKGEGSVQVAGARLWNEPVYTLTVDLKSTGDSLNVKARAAFGKLSGELTYYPRNEEYQGAFDVRGVKLEDLENVRSRNLPVRGVLTAAVEGRGTVKSPELEARVDVPELGLGQTMMREVKARASVAAKKAHLELTSAVANAFVHAQGTVDLAANYYASATLETRGLPLGPFFTMYVPGQRNAVEGELDLRASLSGPLKEPALVTASMEVPKFRAGYQALQISNSGPIRVDYRNGVLEIGHAAFTGTGTDIELQGAIPLGGSSPLSLSARGTVDLKVLSVLNRQTESAGQILLDIRARGDRAHPDVTGDIHVVNAAFSTPTTPLGVERVNGDITIHNQRAEITRLAGQAGGGNISVQGFVQYQPGVQFHLAVTGKSVRLRYPEGVRAILDSNLLLTGTPSSSSLSGNVLIDRLSFTKEFDLATFLSQFGTESSPPPSSGFAQNLELDVGIGSAGELGLTSGKVSLQGQANLRVRGTAANPVILGRATVTDGELFFLNHRYHIDRGVVTFANPARTEPVINVLATTKVNEFKLSLNLIGPIERLRTNYVSDPPLPAVDIINLLARGKTAEAATPGSMGANTLLAQGLAGQVSNRVERLAGLSSLQIDPMIGGNNRNPSARLAIQERVTKDVLFTYATDVTSTQNVLVQIEYQVTPGWSVNVTRDENGNFSIQGRRRKTF